jgi:hypothetical protein
MANLESAQNSDLTADEFLKEIQSRCAKNAGSVPIPRQSSQKASAMLGNSQAQLQMEQHHREAIAAIQDRIHHDIELAIQHLGLAPKSKQEDDHDDDDEFFVEEITNAAVIRHK